MIADSHAPTATATPQERPSWPQIRRRVLASIVTALCAALVFQLLGEGTLPAVVIGAALPQLLEQVAQRLGWWESRKLGPVAVVLGLIYGRDWIRNRVAGLEPAVSATTSGGIATVAAAVTLGALTVGGAILDRPPASLTGTWQTTAFTVTTNSGLVSTQPGARETWTVARDAGCTGPNCGFRVAVSGGTTFTLEADEDGTFVGSAEGIADCVSETPPHDVTVADAYDDHWTYRVTPRPSAVQRPSTLVIAAERVATATDDARAESCRSPVTATYRATAARTG